MRAPRSALDRFVLIASLVLVAFNMRPSLSSIGPVLPEAMRDTGLTPATSALVTTLPVLLLGLFGLAAPAFARRWGQARAVLVFLLVLAVGLAVRAAGTAAPLIAGCALGGAAIGVINVLAPAIIKREFPDQAAGLMGVYTMALCAGAAAAAGATVPLERAFGGAWGLALAAWALAALVAAAVWLVQLRGPAEPVAPAPKGAGGELWRDPLAWSVTLFTGLQSALAYSIFAWLAPMLRARGLSAVEAGLVVSVSILLQAVFALAAPVMVGWAKDQRAPAATFVLASLVGFAGCLYAPLSAIWLWAVVLAFGQGATFALALTMIVLRAPDSATAGRLSAMAQGIGYSFASAGPLLMGLLRGWTGRWDAAAAAFFVIGLACVAAGVGAGRLAYVRAGPGLPDRPAPAAA
jgi:CP family cyanate transporter-like MFS transporter